ncbi:cytochrome P450 [Saccharopolyspora shandongensis]|uniref:cytochrome P450 n=1 Tax=Saccharopolyspora shandongensis TaxID=418495 RepID=UPI0033CA58C5
MPQTDPVHDWSGDYDIFDPDYVRDPAPYWAQLRDECPVAHTERWGGSWLPTRYEDVFAAARMVPALSSEEPTVVQVPEFLDGYRKGAPPISSDPPEHTWTRKLINPFFAPAAIERLHDYTEDLCNRLIDGFVDSGSADAAVDYAQQIPSRVIARLLGLDPEQAEWFVYLVREILEFGQTEPDRRTRGRQQVRELFYAELTSRRADPRDDVLTHLATAEVDGEPVSIDDAAAICHLLLIAGVDTTWSSIGSSLFHLGTHPEDRRRLAAEPELVPSAVEEFLRFYSPVTMARVAKSEVRLGDAEIKAGDRVLMNFPGANRDPQVFPNAGEVVIDRGRNRHVAFGVGIHRCAGSHLARMEMNTAISVWLSRIPEFEVADVDAVTWAGGQVRGPRNLPVRF